MNPTGEPRSKMQIARDILCWGIVTLSCTLGVLLSGCATHQAAAGPDGQPQVFASPENAAQALAGALRTNDVKQLSAIMGNQGQEIIASGDDVADRQRYQKFVSLYDQKHFITHEARDSATLVVGNSAWPFPVPIVRRSAGWSFDAKAGQEEILNRRIGDDELSAIQVCKAIADAQHEYALRDPEHSGVNEYAQKFASDPGRRNGLYWPSVAGEKPSPLGELAAEAAAEGYTRKAEGPTPYHGYYYRILTAQGSHAPGGELDYIVKGKMTLGFALVAYPAEYDNSGIMTFIMGPDGVVYQKDLGENTKEIASTMKAFDPDPSWTKVQ